MLPRQLDESLQCLERADRAGGIVGIDDDDGARPGVDLLLDLVKVRLPAQVFFQVVEDRPGIDFSHHRRIARIFGARQEDIFSRIEQGGKTNLDSFADAFGYESILHVSNRFAIGFAANRLQRLGNSSLRAHIRSCHRAWP